MTGDNNINFINLTRGNVPGYGIGCLKNPKHPGFRSKQEWFKQTIAGGLTIKLLMTEGKQAGFLEYAPGGQTWRAVNAPGYNVIHCIWVYPRAYQAKGYGGLLVEECLKDSREQKMKGAAVVTSKGPWIASKDLFLRHGFVEVDRKGRFELMVHKFHGAADPVFNKEVPTQYRGLNLLYAEQCPLLIKFLADIKEFCEKEQISINIIKLKNAKQAQKNPNPFGIFALIYDNEVVADNPISAARFRNIIKKELKL